MEDATNEQPSSKQDLEDQTFQNHADKTDSSDRLQNEVERNVVQPQHERVRQLINEERLLEDDLMVISEALEIGLSIIEATEEDITEVKRQVWKDYNLQNKLKNSIIQRIKYPIAETGLIKSGELKEYSLEDLQQLEKLLFEPSHEVKE